MTLTDNKLAQLLLSAAVEQADTAVFVTESEKSHHSDGATHLLRANDPFSAIKAAARDEQLTVVFTDELTLLQALPHLYDIRTLPIVVNVDLRIGDYAAIAALKDLEAVSLVSNDAATTVRNTELAIQTVRNTQRLVLNYINYRDVADIPAEVHFVQNEDALETTSHFRFAEGSSSSASSAIINLSPYYKTFASNLPKDTALVDITVYRPWGIDQLLELLPKSVTKIVIVEGAANDASGSSTTAFEPLLLDFFSDFNKLVERNIDQLILTKVGALSEENTTDSLDVILANLNKPAPKQDLFIGKAYFQDEQLNSHYLTALRTSLSKIHTLEDAYIKVLRNLFASDLQILNEYNEKTVGANTPEYGFGYYLQAEHSRQAAIDLAKLSLDAALYKDVPSETATQIVNRLADWIKYNQTTGDDLKEANNVATELFQLLNSNRNNQTVSELLKIAPSEDNYTFKSNWLVGSDAWSYDIGNSGVHQVLASKKNINLLIIDSDTQENRDQGAAVHKKNIGLYALNFHDVYVASVAIYSSYTQLLTSFVEASKFNGPSVVMAYLPYNTPDDSPISILKESKIAVESGYWPLYRYDPLVETDAFKLDSSSIRKELQDFLDRENKLTLLTQKFPEIGTALEYSASDAISRKRDNRNKLALDSLLDGLSGPPLHIYYASDGGNATSIAKRLATRGAARGLKATSLSMDDIIVEELPGEENVVFVTSTAGQGEFPQDGKSFWDALKSVNQLDLTGLNVAVFGMGDSQYWPRKEDERYYNKPSKDLSARLQLLGAHELTPLGLGDDQDDDGYETGYQPWEAQLWTALGVDNVEVGDEPKELTAEDVKLQSNFLRGTLADDLVEKSTGNITSENTQIAKFHGLYMQDDRDLRDARKQQGLEPLYAFMARMRTPHGTLTPDQWLLIDKLSDETGNGTIKLTNRATVQLHGVLKKDIKHTIRTMNSLLMDTLAGSGDVNRDVMISAIPGNAKVHDQLVSFAKKVSEYFLPKTTAYHEIWLQGIDERDDNPNWSLVFENRPDGPRKKKTMVSSGALVDVEPIYSPVYLPRKFKVNITAPPYNDVDVWSSDVGLISIVNPETQLIEGFNLLAGGGMGTNHNNKKTWPDTGKMLGFVSPDKVIKAIESVIIFQRDNGDRTNRKHARLRYTMDTVGFDKFKDIVEEQMGFKFLPPKPFVISSNIDNFGWIRDETGKNHFTAFIENGRVLDSVGLNQKTGLRKVAELMKSNNSGGYRLTGNQHVIISNIEDKHIDAIKKVLHDYQLDNLQTTGLRLSSSSCVGFPTCGLAMAESERFFPIIVTEIEEALEEYGLRHDSVVLRITGCGNGCARPWVAEVALVGKAPNTYNIMLGGGYYGQRLNKLYRSNVKDSDIAAILKPLFKRWAIEREQDEHFGDFLIRSNIIKETTEGKYIHEDVAQEAF